MSYYPKRKSYTKGNTYMKKYASYRKKPSSYNVKRATYTKGAVKTTSELKQFFFAATCPMLQSTAANYAQGIPWVNAPQADGNAAFTMAANHGILCIPHAIGQGPGANQRIGNKITASRLDLTFAFTHDVTPNVTTLAPVMSVWLVVDTQWSGALTINLADLQYPNGGTNQRVAIYNNANRFKVLKKLIINPTIASWAGDDTAASAARIFQMQYSKSFNLKKLDIKYRAATAGQNTPSDVQNNMIFLAFGVFPSALATVDLTGSLTYYDS